MNFLKHLKWWEDLQNLITGTPINPHVHNTVVFTGASQKVGGAHLCGLCSNKESQLHIKVLKLKAVLLALKGFQGHLKSQKALVSSDNSMVVPCLNKEEGTHSISICSLIWWIRTFINHIKIQIKARHVPRSLNVIADPYHDKVIQTEWSLHQQIFNQICIHQWETCSQLTLITNFQFMHLLS